MNKLKRDVIFTIISLVLIVVGFILTNIVDQADYKWLIMITFGIAFIIGGYSKAVEGVSETIEKKQLNVEILMILAAIGAFFLNEYADGAILIFIFAVSGILEEYAHLRSEKALTELLTLAPETATLIKDGKEEVVKVQDLNIGEIVRVNVGEQIPIDGIIHSGSTSIDESMITGEFVPVDKKEGSSVYAGTINKSSTITVKVLKDAKDTVVQKIVDFVKDAQETNTPTETFIEKFEKWYVYAVIMFALGVATIPALFNWWTWDISIQRGIIVLVVGSPCALVASVTPAILASLSNGARQGVLIKGGPALEKIRDINAVVFDKTGTITEGTPDVVGFTVYGINEDVFLRNLVAMERQSSHPLAVAIVNHFKDIESIEITTRERPGYGIEATIDGDTWLVGRFDMNKCEKCKRDLKAFVDSGSTLVNVAKNNEMVGIVQLKDTIREDALETMDDLRDRNIETIMLTGDNVQTAKDISERLHISSYQAECFPEQKVEEIKKLKADGKKVMMIGDGINDAPALAISDVSVAMGSGTDVSMETADIVFMNNNLKNIIKMIKLSERLRRIVLQNIIFSMSVITFLMISNLFGVVDIRLGVIAHEGSTILVILNSLRLLIRKK